MNDALAKHEVAEPSVNDAIFNMQPSDLSVAVSLLGDGAGDIFESNCEKYMQLFHLYDPAVIHARPTDHRAAHSDRSPTPYHSSNHPITGLTTGALPAGQPTPSLPASSPTDHGRGAVPPPAPYQTTPNPPTTYAHHSGPPAYDPSHPHPSQLPPPTYPLLPHPNNCVFQCTTDSSGGQSAAFTPTATFQAPLHAPGQPSTHYYSPPHAHAAAARSPPTSAPRPNPQFGYTGNCGVTPTSDMALDRAPQSACLLSLQTPTPPFYFNPAQAPSSQSDTNLPPWPSALIMLTPRTFATAEAHLKQAVKAVHIPAQTLRLLERCKDEPLYYLTVRSQLIMLMARLYIVVILLETPRDGSPPTAFTVESGNKAVHDMLSMALADTTFRTLITARTKTIDKHALVPAEALYTFVNFLDDTFLSTGIVRASVGAFYSYEPTPGDDALTVLNDLESRASLRGVDDDTVVHVFTSLLTRLNAKSLLAHLGTTNVATIAEYRRLIMSFPDGCTTPLRPVLAAAKRVALPTAAGDEDRDPPPPPLAPADSPANNEVLNAIRTLASQFATFQAQPGPPGRPGGSGGPRGPGPTRDRLDTTKIYPILFPQYKGSSDPKDVVGADCPACEKMMSDFPNIVWIDFDNAAHGPRPDGTRPKLPRGQLFKHGRGRCINLHKCVDCAVQETPENAWMKNPWRF